MTKHATSGNISTQYFGDHFDANKVESQTKIEIIIEVPSNITIMFKFQKITMKEVHPLDQFSVNDECKECKGLVDPGLTNWSRMDSVTDTGSYYIKLDRKVSIDDIRKMNFDMMPGFQVSWNYDEVSEPESSFEEDERNKQFVR